MTKSTPQETSGNATTASGPTVTCPGCGKPAVYSAANPFRPFCCERCRLLDLGAWASERYRIAENTPPDGGIPPSSPNEQD